MSSYEDVQVMKEKIDNAYDEFKNNIIQPTDKSKLKAAINDAQRLYNDSVEGSSEGQYKPGSKATLLKAINEAKKVYDNIVSQQEEIDNSTQNLKNAINTFKNSKVSNFTKEKALQYAIRKFGQPYKDQPYLNEFGNGGYDWDYLENKYGSKRDQLALNEYTFKSGQLTKNGKKYYIIENASNFYLEHHVYIFELKVYEDGTVEYEQIF